VNEFEWFKTLVDIDDEISNIDSQKKIYELELKRWSSYHGGDLANKSTYLASMRRQNRIEKIMISLNGRKEELEEQRKEAVDIINDFKGLEHEILRLRYIKGYKLTQIAEELGYSYQHIKNTHSRVMKDIRA